MAISHQQAGMRRRRQRSQRTVSPFYSHLSAPSSCLALMFLVSTLAAAAAAAGAAPSVTTTAGGRLPVLPRRASPLSPTFGLLTDATGCSRSALAVALGRRGGSTAARSASSRSGDAEVGESDDELNEADNEEEERLEREQKAEEEAKERAALLKWKYDQQVLLNLRQTYLSEVLAKRGIPLATMAAVSTADGDKPPEMVDWDCALSTYDEPKTCLYSFDAEPNTKVVAPFGTAQWISLSALNRLRRTDVAKVEPMWHSQYAILRSWFSDESEFCLFQHAGVKGFIVSNILLDFGGGAVLRSLVLLTLFSAFVVAMPALEYIVNRLLVSAPFWARWISWHRIVRAALPFKLLMGQIAWKGIAKAFLKLEGTIRDCVVDMECSLLEDCVPLTVGQGTQIDEEDDDIMEGEEGSFVGGGDLDPESEEDDY